MLTPQKQKAYELSSLSSSPNILAKKRQQTTHYVPAQYQKYVVIYFIAFLLIGGQILSSLPFIFKDPVFYCQNSVDKVLIQCTEKQACNNLNQGQSFTIQKYWGCSSIITQNNFYCQQKLKVASIQTVYQAGHWVGCAIMVFLSYKINPKFYILSLGILQLVMGVSMLIGSVANNLTIFSIFYGVWAAAFEMSNAIIAVAIPYCFRPQKAKQLIPAMEFYFSLFGLLNPFIFYISRSWRIFIFLVVITPNLIFGTLKVNISQKINQQQKKLAFESPVIQQNNHLQSPMSILQILKSTEYRLPMLSIVGINFYAYINSTIPLFSVNHMRGNFLLNFQMLQIVPVLSAFMIMQLTKNNISSKKILLCLYSATAFFYLTKFLWPIHFKSVPVIIGKYFSDGVWAISVLYTVELLPKKCLIATSSFKYFVMYSMGNAIPIIIYVSWLLDIDVFILLGILLVGAIYIVHISDRNLQEQKLRELPNFKQSLIEYKE